MLDVGHTPIAELLLSLLHGLFFLGGFTDEFEHVHGVSMASDPRCLVGFCAAQRAQRNSSLVAIATVCTVTKLAL